MAASQPVTCNLFTHLTRRIHREKSLLRYFAVRNLVHHTQTSRRASRPANAGQSARRESVAGGDAGTTQSRQRQPRAQANTGPLSAAESRKLGGQFGTSAARTRAGSTRPRGVAGAALSRWHIQKLSRGRSAHYG